MSKNTKQTSETQPKRGRPAKPFNWPDGTRKGSKLTINEMWAANPQFKCRLSMYNRVGDLKEQGLLRNTGDTAPANGENNVGKPGDIYEVVAVSLDSLARSKASKKAAKSRKTGKKAPKAATPSVDLTPAVTAPVAEPAPVVAEPVAVTAPVADAVTA